MRDNDDTPQLTWTTDDATGELTVRFRLAGQREAYATVDAAVLSMAPPGFVDAFLATLAATVGAA